MVVLNVLNHSVYEYGARVSYLKVINIHFHKGKLARQTAVLASNIGPGDQFWWKNDCVTGDAHYFSKINFQNNCVTITASYAWFFKNLVSKISDSRLF